MTDARIQNASKRCECIVWILHCGGVSAYDTLLTAVAVLPNPRLEETTVATDTIALAECTGGERPRAAAVPLPGASGYDVSPHRLGGDAVAERTRPNGDGGTDATGKTVAGDAPPAGEPPGRRVTTGDAASLHEATLALFACDTRDRLAEIAATRATALLTADGCFVALLDADGVVMSVAAGTGPFARCQGLRVNYGLGAAGRAWQTRAPVLASEASPAVPGEEPDAPLAAALAVPLVLQARVLGVVGLRFAAGRRADPATAALLARFADGLALALEHVQRFEVARLEAAASRRAEETLRHLALHDALTGLPNRTLFQDRLRLAIRTAERTCQPFTLLFVDLDRFKEVNDSLGHQFGDRVLERAGARLREALRDSDTVARLGGDEFAVLLPAAGTEVAQALAQKALHQLAAPLLLDGRQIDVGASIGIAVYPEHGADAESMIHRADTAMYVAKQRGGGIAIYAAERDERSPSRIALATDLRRGLSAGEFGVQLLDAGEAAPGLVARLRVRPEWRHPRLGVLPAPRFVPLAEQSGLIGELTRQVIRAALDAARSRADQTPVELCIALSSRLLHDAALPAQLVGLLFERDAAPESLRLELAVDTIWPVSAANAQALDRLRATGIHLSINDYDPGRVSPAAFRALPVDELQLTPTAFEELLQDEHGRLALAAAATLANGLGLRLLVETADIAEARELAALGCMVARVGPARRSGAGPAPPSLNRPPPSGN
jgi:diguanylate cyclase (GGDEF)-like protein